MSKSVRFCHFYEASSVCYFEIKLCVFVEHNIAHIWIFFTIFCKNLKYHFQILQENKLYIAQATQIHTHLVPQRKNRLQGSDRMLALLRRVLDLV
jgi:hypothetical protein